MKIIKVKDKNDVDITAAAIILAELTKTGRRNIAVTAGSSPVGTYQQLKILINQQPSILKKAYFYNIDEMPNPDKENSVGVTRATLDQILFTPLAIPEKQIVPLTCENFQSYDQQIEQAGGLDLMLLGLGGDGHFCCNMPKSTKFNLGTHKVIPQPEYPWYESFTKLYKTSNNLPDYLVTTGPKTVFKAKQVVIIAAGLAKAKAVKELVMGEVSTLFPATILQLHPNITVIVDKDAGSLIE